MFCILYTIPLGYKYIQVWFLDMENLLKDIIVGSALKKMPCRVVYSIVESGRRFHWDIRLGKHVYLYESLVVSISL